MLALPGIAVRCVRGVVWLARLARRLGCDVIVTNTAAPLSGPIVARLIGRPHVWYIREIVDDPRWIRTLVRFLGRVPRGR